MWKRILKVLSAALVLALAVAIGQLAWAHRAIRQERSPLPRFDTVLAANADGGPVRLSYINTASQEMSRSTVLDAQQDPWPQEAYVMSHPSYVLEWPDGKLLLIDTGMTRDGAIAFGKPSEWVGAKPIHPLGSVADRLGEARQRVAAVVFTHLHTDHVGGLVSLCDNPKPFQVFMTPAQAERPNYTTRAGLELIRSQPSARIQELPVTTLAPLPGFPGAYVIAAGGHTPGGQIVIADLQTPNGTRRVGFVGDIVNNIDGITYNLPKPLWYSLLIVPEDRERLDELRRWLRTLRDTHGVSLLAAHDQLHIERSGIPAWPAT